MINLGTYLGFLIGIFIVVNYLFIVYNNLIDSTLNPSENFNIRVLLVSIWIMVDTTLLGYIISQLPNTCN